MVSKLSHLFRHIIYKDDSEFSSPSRKRRNPSSLNDVEGDVLETPAAKRAKTRSSEEGPSNSSNKESTFVRMVSWFKVKRNTFNDMYFSRPLENGGDDSTQAETSKTHPQTNIREQSVHKSVANSSHATSNFYRSIHRSHHSSGKETFAKPESAVRYELSRKSINAKVPSNHQTMHDKPSSSQTGQNQYHPEVNRSQLISEVKKQDTSRTALPSMEAARRSQTWRKQDKERRSTSHFGHQSSVHDKLFLGNTSRASTSTKYQQSRLSRPRNITTANECFRLDAKQRYHELLQQFTTVNINRTQTSTLSTLSRTKEVTVKGPDHSSLRAGAETSIVGTVYQRPSAPRPSVSTQQSKYHSTRVLPHQYESRREIREAARSRLHKPVSDLSPESPAFRRRIATPAQPDFANKSDRSDSPVVLEVRTSINDTSPWSPRFQRFEDNRRTSPFVDEKWVQEIKEKFESSVRLTHREAEEQKIRMQLLEEKKQEEKKKALEQAKAQLLEAEKDSAVDLESEFPLIEPDLEPEVEEEEVLPELTPEMEDEVHEALIPKPPEEVLVEGFRLSIKRMDFQTLNGLNWLNDEIINFYMNLLMERGGKESFPSVHAFNTFFYSKLLKDGYMSLRRWTKRVDVFSKDILLVPIHLGVHWCMAAIDFRKKCITYYDSMGGNNKQCLDALKNYVIEEHKDKKGSPYDMTGWSYIIAKDIPQQMNGSDCGVFACKFAEYVARDVPLSFTQHDMPYFRKRMVWEILHKKLL